MSPLEVVNKKASRCSPTSKTVVARIGVMAVGSAGAEVGGVIRVAVADDPQATANAIVKPTKAGINSPVFETNLLITWFMVLSRKSRM